MALKPTSDPIAVSFEVTETGANTFTQEEIGLQLDVLNNEVALVYAIDLDLESPDALAGIDTRVTANLCSTSQTQTALPKVARTSELLASLMVELASHELQTLPLSVKFRTLALSARTTSSCRLLGLTTALLRMSAAVFGSLVLEQTHQPTQPLYNQKFCLLEVA